MPGRLVSRGRGRQPSGTPLLDLLHPLGAALDHLYSAAHPGGHDLIGGLLAPPPAGVTVSRSAEGLGWVATGAVGTNKTIAGVNRFPIVLFGYGRFADATGNWRLSPLLQSSGTGYLAGIRLASSTDVSLVVQFNFGTTRTITIGLPTALNVPIAAIAVIYSATDYRLFVNGRTATGTLSPGTLGAFDLTSPPAGTFSGRLWANGFGCGRAIPDAAALDLTANPEKLWRMFRSPLRRLFLPGGGGALSGAASGGAQAGGAANPSVQVALAGVGVAVAGGSAQAQVAVPLSAAAIAQAGGGATATATVTLSAAGLAQAAGAAGLDVAAVLAAAGSAQAGGSATLSGGAPGALSATGGAQAGGAAVLSVTVTLAAAGGAQAGGSATISGGAPGALSASGGAQAGGAGTLVATVQLTAAGLAQALGAGQLAIQVPLAAFAAAVAGGSATLVDLAAIALLKDHRWSVAGNRVWRVRRARKLSVGRSRHAQ